MYKFCPHVRLVHVVLWIAALLLLSYFLVIVLHVREATDHESWENMVQQLDVALQSMSELRSVNDELKMALFSQQGSFREATRDADNKPSFRGSQMVSSFVAINGPSRAHEAALRRLYDNALEVYFSLTGFLKRLEKRAPDQAQWLKGEKRELVDLSRNVLSNVEDLFEVDGARRWRSERLRSLSDGIQQRLREIQNPTDCDSAKKILCDLNKACGFSCQLHHVVYCLLLAYVHNRTLILNGNSWSYSQRGWTSIFRPLSDNCAGTAVDTGSAAYWVPGRPPTAQVVRAPIVDTIPVRPAYFPLSFPDELAAELIYLHSYPPVWWIGELATYAMRYQPEIEEQLKTKKESLRFTNPIVGIHVRRTDKLMAEAQFHPLEEYMAEVEMWYSIKMLRNNSFLPKGTKKRVYIATDEPKLFSEAREQYPDYEFIGDQEIAKSAAMRSRYTDQSLVGVVTDVHFLARCNYLVCTFSSQVCRLAYELMQSLLGDAAYHFRSLDDVFYYGGQQEHLLVAIHSHSPKSPEEIELKPGDLVQLAGNHWDGRSKGMNKRTGQTGLFPSFKVRERWKV